MPKENPLSYNIQQGDALACLQDIAEDSVSLIITDPPYDTLEKWRNMGTTTRLKDSKQSSNEWFPTVPPSYFTPFFKECYRVLMPNSHLYVMCDEETSDTIKPLLQQSGFSLRKSLIWHKVGAPEIVRCPNCAIPVSERFSKGTPGMGYPYRSSYEMIILAEKGKRKAPENKGVRNFIEVAEVPWIKNKNAYPTQKPVDLIRIMVRQSSQPGDLVLDPFAGSGSTGEAAYLEGRSFLGFDISPKALQFIEENRNWTIEATPKEDFSEDSQEGILDIFS